MLTLYETRVFFTRRVTGLAKINNLYYNCIMAENSDVEFLGKKIFFLHPSALVQNQVVAELGQEEFEVYFVKDEVKLRHLLKKYPASVVFASINEGLRENAWEEWFRAVSSDKEIAGVDIGIIASSDEENTKRKYISEFHVSCGYTVQRANVSALTKQLIDILNGVNAKGRRKYLRAITGKETNTTVNLPMNGTFVNGLIKDISVVGFSCSFPEDPKIAKNSLFSDIQIRLQSQLLKAEGIVFGSRMDGDEKNYVILFSQRTSPDVRTRIRKYIQSCLQNKIDDELKEISRS